MAFAPRAFVIGHPIDHSRSPLLHGFWLREAGLAGTYEKIDVAPDTLAAFIARLREAGFVGGNVTVPHKTAIVPLLDDTDAAARVIGAVNTVWIDEGRLIGGNTDAMGFIANLDDEAPGWDSAGKRAIVLGAGGAARAVVHGLSERGFAVGIVNRTEATADSLAKQFGRGAWAGAWDRLPETLAEADLLVNTTVLGMVGKPPLTIDLTLLRPGAIVCDIVYTPLETALLRAAALAGHRTVGGLGMLLHQGVPGFARWFGQTPRVTPALRALLEADVAAGSGRRP